MVHHHQSVILAHEGEGMNNTKEKGVLFNKFGGPSSTFETPVHIKGFTSGHNLKISSIKSYLQFWLGVTASFSNLPEN